MINKETRHLKKEIIEQSQGRKGTKMKFRLAVFEGVSDIKSKPSGATMAGIKNRR